MAYFIPSYFQKRILRYALSRLDLLDSEQLDLDNLDIAWGKKSVLELRNLGVHLEKLTSILSLPPQLVLTRASIKLLKVTVPADLYNSGILAEVDGIDISLDADTQAPKEPIDTPVRAGGLDYEKTEKRMDTDQPRNSRVGPGVRSEEESLDPRILPTTDDLAKSFLQAEPRKEKVELQAAIAQSQHLEESEVLDVSGQSSAVGVGNGLSLPTFLSGFLKGIRDRFSLRIQDIEVNVFLRVTLPFENSSMVASDRSENVTLRMSIKNLNYQNMLETDLTQDNRSNQYVSAAHTSSSVNVEAQRWVRQIVFSNIQGTITSEASIFSSLSPSPAPSSTFESIVAGSPSKLRQKACDRDSDLGRRTANAAGHPVDFSDLPDKSHNTTPPGAFLPEASQQGTLHSELYSSQNEATVSLVRNPKLASIMEQVSPQESSGGGNRRDEDSSSGNEFQSLRRYFSSGHLDESTSTFNISGDAESCHELSRDVLPERHRASHSDNGSSESSVRDVQHSPSPPEEDLTASKIFSHEEAESMYMSAMSSRNLEKEDASPIMPGAWYSSVEADNFPDLHSIPSVEEKERRNYMEGRSTTSSPTAPKLSHSHVVAVQSPPSNDNTDSKLKLEETENIPYLDEPTAIPRMSTGQSTDMKSPHASNPGTEGPLHISKPFMFIDHISLRILPNDTGPAFSSSSSDTPSGTLLTSDSSVVQPEHSKDPYNMKGPPTYRRSKRSDNVKPSPSPESPNLLTKPAASVSIDAVLFNTDMGLAKLTAMMIREISKIFPAQESATARHSSVISASQTEITLVVHRISWRFYDRVVGLPVVGDKSRCTDLNAEDASTRSELLLEATVQGLESISQAAANSYKSKVTMGRVAFGYASGSILSFDSQLKLRDSSRDSLAPTNQDLILTITKGPRVSLVELSTLPIQVCLDLRRLDETFAWLGGFSSILDLGNSMISTVTTLDPHKSGRNRDCRINRGVHFETPRDRSPVNTETSQQQSVRKVTARIGGVTCRLLGSESSFVAEGSALKVVSRAEGFGLQIDRVNISGLCLNKPADRPAAIVHLSNVRAEYLPEPKEVDLARLLALLSPSRDKYGVDDDILLDTLLRQRRQGGVIRLTTERSETRISHVQDLRHFSTLSDELKKLATVAKYLPDDDRPGILTLVLIRQFVCEAQTNELLGPVDADLKNIEFAHITIPCLLALGVSDIRIRRNRNEELVTATAPMKGPEDSSLPMIMARFVGNEMEPTVKLKLYNVCVEYHIPFILAIMRLNGNAQAGEAVADMADSILDLTERTRSKEKPFGSSQESSHSSDIFHDKYSTLKVDIIVRDSLLGLNPRKSSSKGIVVLTETHFAGTMPKDQEANATLEVQKAALMIIDDQEKVKPPEMTTESMSIQPDISRIQALEAMGYVSIGSVSAAGAVLQVTKDREGTGRSIDVEIRDNLFILETCADSTQTLQAILNGLAPPLPPSEDLKYRTEVVPIENMLSSFSGMAFTSDGVRVGDETEEDYFQSAVGQDDCDDEDMESSLYDLESSKRYSNVSGTMLDEEADSVVVGPLTQVFETASSISSSDDHDEEATAGFPLEIQDDHFGSKSSVGGTAYEWNSKQNTYGISKESASGRSPLRVRIRDVHLIWNLFDGYDWQRTRDTISQAIADAENKALVQQSKREKRKTHDVEDDEESIIGDFLFNSIYIGVPANRDPRNLTRQVSRNLDDITSESESSAATTISNAPRPPGTPLPVRSKRPRLARSKHHKIALELKGVSADVMVFPPGSGETQSSIDIRVQDLEIFDHVPTSTWKKFATYMQDAGERESGSSMIHVEMLNVRPVADLAASEIILKATILPIRLHVDQDALDFITRFFEFKNDEAREATIKSEAAFLQRVEVFPVRLRLDFKPKRVDYAEIRSGRTNEFMNFFILDRADMVLRHVIIYGISGFDRLGKTLNDIWMPDIKRNQLPGILAGLAPVRSLVNVGGGVRDLVVVPVREYQKNGRIVRSLQKGALAFAKTTTNELVKLGAKLAIGTQTVLQGAEDLLTQPEQRSEAVGGWEEAELDEDEKKHISLYADQPVGVVQGLRGAYASLERDLLTAKDAIVAMPGEVMESCTAGGAAKAVLRGAPTVVLRPALGVSKVIGRTLMGATNSLDPENRRRIEEKYKKH